MFSTRANLRRLCSQFQRFSEWLNVSEEIQQALNDGVGIVALESTVITHGLPYPANRNLAFDLEKIVRQQNCIPATIALADGKIHVGATSHLLDRLAESARSPGSSMKVSRRDIAVALTRKSLGGTTVAATMIIANMAGISVFATGGIGGVHRGVSESWDISADLKELGRTPVVVVCSGVKSILDIPKTVEFLETEGVPTISYGSTDAFPGFFKADSGSKSRFCSNDIREIAEFIETARLLRLNHGFVVGVPIPETSSKNSSTMDNAIAQALNDAKNLGITGPQFTPFVLDRIRALDPEIPQQANIALLKNNASVAGRIAESLSQIRRCSNHRDPQSSSSSSSSTSSSKVFQKDFICQSNDHGSELNQCSASAAGTKSAEVVVVGGTILDVYIEPLEEIRFDGSTHKGRVTHSWGGVGRNHATALTQIGVKTMLISVIGKEHKQAFNGDHENLMNRESISIINDSPTCVYAGFVTKGVLNYGIGSTQSFERISPNLVDRWKTNIETARLVLIDGNLPVETIKHVCQLANKSNIPVWFDPTDVRKASKVFQCDSWKSLSYVTPNANEFIALTDQLNLTGDVRSRIQEVSQFTEFLTNNLVTIMSEKSQLSGLIVTLGKDGIVTAFKLEDVYLISHYKAPLSQEELVNVSGAGDCLNAGIVCGLLKTPVITKPSANDLQHAINLGLTCAAVSLRSNQPVPAALTVEKLQHVRHSSPEWSLKLPRRF